MADVSIRPADLAFLSPYAISNLKRFGDYSTDLKPQGMPARMTLPLQDLVEVAGFTRILLTGHQ